MRRGIHPIVNEQERRIFFRDRSTTLLTTARDFSEEFGSHVAVVAFSPADEPRAFGSPTLDSVLRTYFPDAAPPPPGAAAETVGEAAARVAGMRREMEETKALVSAEWARVASAIRKIRKAQSSAGKRNWWEVDVNSLGEDELPVFVRALEALRAVIEGRIHALASARHTQLWKKQQQ